MSEVKVNKISPRTACGTTTLGDSGDTFTVPSGVTISNSGTATGFGRTGTVDWVTTPKVTGDSPVTAATGSGYFLNTTAGTITINLPAGAAGSIVSMADYAATWQTNNVTVAANGSEKIGGVAVDVTLNTEGQSVTLVYIDSTQGWINTMDSTSNVRGVPPYIAATGGTPACGTTSGDYKIHKFTGPGTFCVSRAAVCAADNLVSYMVVAGGGGGGGMGGGGGGAGGFRELVSPSAPYTASPLDGYPSAPNRITVSATPYSITVGGGGAGGTGSSPSTGTKGTSGSTATFSTISSAGGGGGGSRCSSPATPRPAGYVGSDGGSGGGGSRDSAPGSEGSGNTPPVTPAQGTAGGDAASSSASAAGGGGGSTVAGGQGQPGDSSGPGSTGAGGAGGTGATTEITAASVAYGGGGGGGINNGNPPLRGVGGTGGGGSGGQNAGCGGTPVVATAGGCNTGGGGGGGSQKSDGDSTAQGQAGGSGVVVIRYRFQ